MYEYRNPYNDAKQCDLESLPKLGVRDLDLDEEFDNILVTQEFRPFKLVVDGESLKMRVRTRQTEMQPLVWVALFKYTF